MDLNNEAVSINAWDAPTPTLITKLSTVSPVGAVVTVPVYCNGVAPFDTNPKLPKDELELLRSQTPPLSQNTAVSQQIVNSETNWAYPKLVIETPIPF